MSTVPLDYHEEVFRRLLTKVFPYATNNKGGQEITVDCIFHLGDNGKNLSINPTKALYKCWVCDARGGVRRFLTHMRDEHMITDIDVEAVFTGGGLSAELLKKVPVPVVLTHGYTEEMPCIYPEGTELLTQEGPLFVKMNKYLSQRGFTPDDVAAYKLQAGTKKGSRYYGRVFFPVFDWTGTQLRHWVARTVIGDEPKVLNAGKYYTAYSSSKCLFNAHTVLPGRPVAVCEGVFDAFSVAKHIMPSVALLGKEAHAYHVAALFKKKPSAVYVCLDGEEFKGANKLAERFCFLLPTFVVRLPHGKDPNDVDLEMLEEAFESAEQPILSAVQG